MRTCGVTCGARISFASGAADYLHEGGNGLTDHLVKETASESDDTTPYHSEFVVEGSFQLGPHSASISQALFTSSYCPPLHRGKRDTPRTPSVRTRVRRW